MIRSLLPPFVAVAEVEPGDRGAPPHPSEASLVTGAPERRRREFAAGRSCARRALARLGHGDAAVLVGPEREPLWPEGVVGAITHTAGYGAVAVALAERVRALGIDAERKVPFEAALVAAVCTEAERRALPAGGGVPWAAVAFSAKESLFKAWFPLTRRRIQPHEAAVTLDAARGTFTVRVQDAPPPFGAGVQGRFAVGAEIVFTALTVPVR